MRRSNNPILLKAGNRIPTATTRRSGMKEARVFIPIHCQANMKALTPERKLLRVDILQAQDGRTPQSRFIGVKRSLFFQKV